MGLQQSVLTSIENIILTADRNGRPMLFEHEVYRILELVGLEPPEHLLIESADNVTPGVLGRFSTDRIVLKAVGPQLSHKQKHGGVQVVLKDLDFVRYSVAKMVEQFQSLDTDLTGILLVEFVQYDKDLGNEILLGFRESDSFGPVISFSKGGSDAEHFAAHFSEPNIILAPVDSEWAHALLSSTQIHFKYLAEGKSDYIEKISAATVAMSELACAFSNFFNSESGYVLREFEVNPIVFDPFGRMIPLDGYATFSARSTRVETKSADPTVGLEPFFSPDGIAVVGVSGRDASKPANIVVDNLIQLGRDDVYCVNPRGGEVSAGSSTMPLYPALKDIPSRVNLVVVAVPAPAVYGIVKECADIGAKAVLITAGGFAEVTGDAHVEDQLLSIARRNGMRIMGPNCLGVIHQPTKTSRGLNTFFIPQNKFRVTEHRRSNVAILSQSGAAGIVEINNLRSALSPKTIVSYGNQLDVDPCDLSRYFADDPDVDVMGFYIEGFKPKAGRSFFEVSSKIDKPIVVYKAGRTQAGVRATESHTASIAGEYAVARAALKQAGLIVADTMLDHMGYIKTFALLNESEVNGRRVAVVTNAGYEKTNAADNLGELAVPDLENSILDELKSFLPDFVSCSALLDLTPMVTDEQFARSIDVLLSSSQVDAICVSIVPQAQLIHTTDEEVATYEQNVAARITDAVKKHRKPAVVSVTVESGSDTNYNAFSRVLEEGGVPAYLSAERAMMFLNAFIRYHLVRRQRNLAERLR